LESRLAAIEEATSQKPPKRDYKVEMGPTENVKLFRADPKLLANKFAATMTLVTAGVDPADLQSISKYASQLVEDRERPSGDNSIRDLFRSLVERCPPDERPAEQLVEFLTSADVDRDIKQNNMRQFETNSGEVVGGWAFTIYAPTAEEGENRAKAILRLIDYSKSPLGEERFARAREALAAARRKEMELAKITDGIEALDAKIAQPSDIHGDILSELKAQKIMVTIELSGLSARVKACDEMLKESSVQRELSVSTLQSVSDMKIKAEIERIGIKEKLDQINKFIEEGDSRVATQNRILELHGARKLAEDQLRTLEMEAAQNVAQLRLGLPPHLLGNKLYVCPIEWTN
jgi:hypothetical protein